MTVLQGLKTAITADVAAMSGDEFSPWIEITALTKAV